MTNTMRTNAAATIANASTTTILAVDLGKYKSVACVHGETTGECVFTTIETTRLELQRLIAKVQPGAVIIEACLLAGWVHDLCVELGVRCLVANTTTEAWKFKHLKRKTDKDDALRLAQLYLLDQLPTVVLPPAAVRQWRSLIACRQTWVGRRVAVQNRIRALFVAQGLPAPRGAKACRSADDLRVILGGYGDIRVAVMERPWPATRENINDMPVSLFNRNG